MSDENTEWTDERITQLMAADATLGASVSANILEKIFTEFYGPVANGRRNEAELDKILEYAERCEAQLNKMILDCPDDDIRLLATLGPWPTEGTKRNATHRLD